MEGVFLPSTPERTIHLEKYGHMVCRVISLVCLHGRDILSVS